MVRGGVLKRGEALKRCEGLEERMLRRPSALSETLYGGGVAERELELSWEGGKSPRGITGDGARGRHTSCLGL